MLKWRLLYILRFLIFPWSYPAEDILWERRWQKIKKDAAKEYGIPHNVIGEI